MSVSPSSSSIFALIWNPRYPSPPPSFYQGGHGPAEMFLLSKSPCCWAPSMILPLTRIIAQSLVCFPWLDALLSVLRIMFQPRFQVEGVSIESNGNNPNAHHQLRGILASLIIYWIISGHAIIWTNLEDVTESTKAVHEKTGWEMKLKPIRPFFLLNIQWEYWTRSLRVPPVYGGIQPWRCKVCDPFTRLLSSQWYHSVPVSWQKWSNLQTPGKTMPPTTPIHSSPPELMGIAWLPRM